MKRKNILLTLGLLVAIILQSCSEKKTPVNSFTSDQDTLRVQLTKVKGNDLFSIGYGVPDLDIYSHGFPTEIVTPHDIDSIIRYPFRVDFLEKNTPTFLEFIKGLQNGKPVFILDQNNNKDLTDDPVRDYKQIDWKNKNICVYVLHPGD